jgi:hypothetical protein
LLKANAYRFVLCSVLGYSAKTLHKTAREWGVMLTPTQLENATTAELEALKNRIEGELTRRELAQKEPVEGRQVVEERPASAGTLRSEIVKCGKTRCRKCERGEGHGPYWYLYFRRNGKLTSRYIGKTIPDELEATV